MAGLTPALLPKDVDAMWLVLCAILVLSMQFGFTLLEAGCIRANLRSILISAFSNFFYGFHGSSENKVPPGFDDRPVGHVQVVGGGSYPPFP